MNISAVPKNLTISWSGENEKWEPFSFVALASLYLPTVPSVPLLAPQIVLPPHLDNVRDKLAENIHELWGMNKIELGWTYGKVRRYPSSHSTHKNTLGRFGNGECHRSTWALSSKMHVNGPLTLISQSLWSTWQQFGFGCCLSLLILAFYCIQRREKTV